MKKNMHPFPDREETLRAGESEREKQGRNRK
jgi:hypothetical protein